MNSGFTLLELLLVSAILAILGAIGFGLYYNFSLSIDLEEEQNRITGVLRQAKGSAMAVEQGYAWGVHFDNTDASSPFFTLFSGASYAVSGTTTKYFLPRAVEFETPAPAGTLDIIFTKRTGTTTAATTTVRLRSATSQKKNIAVSAQGLISK